MSGLSSASAKPLNGESRIETLRGLLGEDSPPAEGGRIFTGSSFLREALDCSRLKRCLGESTAWE